MSELIEKQSEKTVDSALSQPEVKKLAEAGVEIEGDEDGEGGNGDGVPQPGDNEEDEEEQGSGSGDGEEQESSDEQGSDEEDMVDQMGNDGQSFDEEDLDEMVEQSEVAGEDVSEDEAKSRAEALEAAGAGRNPDHRMVDETLSDKEAPAEWKREADQLSRGLKRLLDDYLRQERKTEISRGQEHGSFDSSRMIEADRGSQDVFMNKNKPGEKKYHAVLIMDDSGSMGGENISRLKQAATVTAAMAKAMESVGIDVTVYRFARNVRLVKTADQSYDEAQERILEKRTHGSTNLLPALEQVPELTETFGDESFVMVTTDGKPAQGSAVKEQLADINQTKMCLQIDEETDEFESSYDGFAYVQDDGVIQSRTKSLFRRVAL